MPRPRKDSVPFSMKMSANVYKRLEIYCEKKGQTKTTAVERILTEAFDADGIPSEAHSNDNKKRIETRR